jgi:hypothetical protein
LCVGGGSDLKNFLSRLIIGYFINL